MKNGITLLFLVLFCYSYSQNSNNKEKSKSIKKEKPVTLNTAVQDSTMRSRGGIRSEDGQIWSIPGDSNSLSAPEPEDLKIYQPNEPEVKAEFKGGEAKMNEFLIQNFVVSKDMLDKKITGEMSASFVVEKDGSLASIKIIKNLNHYTKQELIRILELMPKWDSAEHNGKKRRALYTLTYTIK